MLKKLLTILACGLLWAACSTTKNTNQEGGLDGDKCYGKSLSTNQNYLVDTDTIRLPVYIGDQLHPEQIDSVLKYFYHHDETGVVDNQPIAIVVDTFYKSQYEWKTIVYGTLDFEAEEKVIWLEVICEKDITPDFLTRLRSVLKSKGYYDHSALDPTVLDINLKAALVRFQEANNLQTGQLDIKSLNLLGLEY